MYMTIFNRSTLLLSCGLFIIYKVCGKDCDTDDIGVAMLSCQQEREALSDASRLNDTSHLCQALQKYSECIGPSIADCKGEALMAFNVIKQQYAAAPYNCHIMEPWNDADTQFQNNVNSQLYNDNDNDNHIVTHGPVDNLGEVTAEPLPGKPDPLKKKQPTPDTTTTSSNAVDPHPNADTTNTAGPSHKLHIIFHTLVILLTASLTTLLFA